MFVHNGKRFNVYAQQVIDGTTYPAGFFADPDSREQLGIEEVEAPARKNEDFYFNTETEEVPYLISTPKDLDSVKASLIDKIKAKRDELWEKGVEFDGYWFHNDVKSRTQWERMATNARNKTGANPYLIGGNEVQWKTMSGEYVPLTNGFILQVIAQMEIQEAQIFNRYAQLENAINACESIEVLEALDLQVNWPEVYSPGQGLDNQ